MISIENLYASYGGSLILQGVTLSIAKGEIKALMGRNGVGKTTLMRTIMGVIAPRSGKIIFDHQPIQGLRTHEIAARGLGYVPQGREIFENFTIWENLYLGTLKFPRHARKIPSEIFEYFPILSERRDQKAGSFSGGEQQMLAIARTLVSQPKMLLLDEPSEGIQPSIVNKFSEILKRINSESGLTIFIVEQNVDMILNIADSCAFMQKGQIVGSYPMETIRGDASIIARHLAL